MFFYSLKLSVVIAETYGGKLKVIKLKLSLSSGFTNLWIWLIHKVLSYKLPNYEMNEIAINLA